LGPAYLVSLMVMASSNLPPFAPNTTGFNYSQPPHPEWTYGQGIEATADGRAWAEGEKAGWKTIDTATENPQKLNATMISGILPRPVAFVSTISEEGVENLAPFSYFNMVSSSPPVISFSSIYTPSGDKDTVRNIRATKGFTVNIISEPWIHQANICCITSPRNVSEWPLSGLRKEPSVHVKAPRVKESAFAMECELLQAIDIIHPTTKAISATLVLGSVKFIHIRKDVLDPERGTVDPGKMKPIARLGGIFYSRIREGFAIPRPSWTEEEETIREALGGALAG